MSIFLFTRSFARGLLVLLAALNVIGVVAGATIGWRRASLENGVIENLHIVMLATAMVAGIVAARRSGGLLRAAFACWAAIMLLLIQRELDFSAWGTESWIYRLRGTDVRLAFWLPIVAILLVWTLRYHRQIAPALRALRWGHLWPVAAVAGFMLLSAVTEEMAKKGTLPSLTEFLVFLEELFELNGYGVIAAMGIAFTVRVSRPASPEIVEARNRLDPAG